jgi:ABC-type uncharacterized transport system ATPase subunit
LVISEELEELFSICDRIAVIAVAACRRDAELAVDRRTVGLSMTGVFEAAGVRRPLVAGL